MFFCDNRGKVWKGETMYLDLRNNELIFSQVTDKKEFNRDLQTMKNLKCRQYKNQYYISLAHFDVVRQVLSNKYRGKIDLSRTYRRFAEKFVLNKEVLTFHWHPNTCKVSGFGMPWHVIIPETSYFDKKATNSKQYGKTWSGYTHLFDVLNGEFPSGLLERITKLLSERSIPFRIERHFEYPKPYIQLNPTFPFTPTKDQIDSVEALEKTNYGIGKLPTGFGKTSYVAASLIARKGVRSLFLANQRVLTDDAKKDFDEVFAEDKIKIGMIGDGIYDPGDITVASIQTIAASLKPPTQKERQLAVYQLQLAEERYEFLEDKEDKDVCAKEIKKYRNRVKSVDKRIERNKKLLPFLKGIDLFIVDEAQVLGTEQWNQFLKICPAPFRYTLSATPTRTDGGGLQIIAATGEVRYESSAEDQIKKGRLSEFVGHFVKFDHKIDRNEVKDIKMEYHKAYEVFIVNNEKRNEHLCKKVVEWAKDFSVLALVTRTEHGEIIKKMLVDMGMQEDDCRYIDGGTAKKYRKDTIEAFRNNEFPVLIGTSIFDVGFNAKNASKIVRFNAGGSEVREPQRAGRTVRLRDDGSIGESYDVIDVNAPFFESQGWKRMKFLRDEFGKTRVKVHPTVIEGELNIVGLRELVAEIPAETDRKKGEDIINRLQFWEKELKEEASTIHEERDLKDILSGLNYKG